MAAGGRLRGLFSTALSQAACSAVIHRRSAPRSVKHIHAGCQALLELRAKPQPGQRVHEIPEYIPTRKVKNPMKMVAVAWAIGFPSGIILFLLTKRQVDKNRLKQLKARQKMSVSNTGEYQSERYRRTSLRPEETTNTKA